MSLPSAKKALMIAALAAPIAIAANISTAQDTSSYALQTPADIVQLSDIDYRVENCGTERSIQLNHLQPRGETAVAERYVLSPEGDAITAYYSPEDAFDDGMATASIVISDGEGGACYVGRATLDITDSSEIDPSDFTYVLTRYMEPRAGQIQAVASVPSDEARRAAGLETLGTMSFGNGQFVVKFLDGGNGIGPVEIRDGSYSAIYGGARYGTQVASPQQVSMVMEEPQPQRNF